MYDNEKIVEMLRYVLRDDDGNSYWVDTVKYEKIRKKSTLSNREICLQLQLKTELFADSTSDALRKRLKRFDDHIYGLYDSPGNITFVKALGLVLQDDEMSFLIPINLANLEKIADNVLIQSGWIDELVGVVIAASEFHRDTRELYEKQREERKRNKAEKKFENKIMASKTIRINNAEAVENYLEEEGLDME